MIWDAKGEGKTEWDIAIDKARMTIQADYVNVLMNDFAKKYPERAWHFPPKDFVDLDEALGASDNPVA